MEITLTELKENLRKYIELSQDEDILVTKNGKVVSRLTEPFRQERTKWRKNGLLKSWSVRSRATMSL